MSRQDRIRQKAVGYYARMLKKQRSEMAQRTVGSTGPLKRYLSAYEKELHNVRSSHSSRELVKLSMGCDIVFFGNYRTDNRPRYELINYLKHLLAKNIKISFAIDLFTVKKERWLKAYVERKLNKTELLKKLGYDNARDGIYLKSYFEILDLLRANRIEVSCLDQEKVSDKNIFKKDIAIAKRIADLYGSNKGAKVICLLPDSWMAKGHLPQLILKYCSSGTRPVMMRIFSGSDNIYLKLLRKRQESKKVIKVAKGRFVFNLTNPLERYNSFFNYLDGEDQLKPEDNIDEAFKKILASMNEELKLGLNVKFLRYRLYSNFEIAFIEKILKQQSLSENEKERILRYVMATEGYFLPREQIIYLGDLSLTHAAEEAGHYLRYVKAGLDKPLDGEDRFYSCVVNEAFAYMASKIIVPSRTPVEKGFLNSAFKSDLSDEERQNIMIHSLGYELGEKLYKKIKRHQISRRRASNLFSKKIIKGRSAKSFYEDLRAI